MSHPQKSLSNEQALLILVGVVICVSSFAQQPHTYPWHVPNANGMRVVEEAQLLTPETLSDLEQQIRSYEDAYDRTTRWDRWSRSSSDSSDRSSSSGSSSDSRGSSGRW